MIDKQIEEMVFTDVDILANDLNQHCADLAETYCGDTNCLTCLAHALTNKGYRKASDVAREIFEEIRAESSYCVASQNGVEIYHTKLYNISAIKLDELEKKYESESNNGN